MYKSDHELEQGWVRTPRIHPLDNVPGLTDVCFSLSHLLSFPVQLENLTRQDTSSTACLHQYSDGYSTVT